MPQTRARHPRVWVLIVLAGVTLIAWQLFYVAPPPQAGPVGDWPQWRYDASRTAACPGRLPDKLTLQWSRKYPALTPAWEDPVNQDRMPYDRVYEPVVSGSTLVFGSNRNDRVTALDTRTGREKWRFYCDGPVRFPAIASGDKVYFTSDDGFLYCLTLADGQLQWRKRGGPDSRKILGNGRLISAWPARGGPVLADGVVYWAASIWPLMGVFIHAVDAETGDAVWTNDGVGQMWLSQPHNAADAFAGIAPQGAMAVAGDKLLVPGGRSVPACFDRATGKLLYYHLDGSKYQDIKLSAPYNKIEGGSHVAAVGGVYFNHRGLGTMMYNIETGNAYMNMHQLVADDPAVRWTPRTTYTVLTDDVVYLSGNPVSAYDLGSLERGDYHRKERDHRSKRTRDTRRYRWRMENLWTCDVDGTTALIKVGNRLFAGGPGTISAITLAGRGKPGVTWQADIEGTPARLLAADGRLFAVTLEGTLYCFGPDEVKPTVHPEEPPATPARTTREPEIVRQMLKTSAVSKGYCLAFGLDTGDLVEAIARHSDLQVIAVDADPQKVADLRRRFDDAGLLGTKISVHVGDPVSFNAPPYLSPLVVFESLKTTGFDKADAFLRAVFHSLRPYGGVAWLPLADPVEQATAGQRVASADLGGARVRLSADRQHLLFSREGPLPESASWTHLYGDIANTAKSDDRLVKAPLGVLWFGGNSHLDVLPRHAHGPTEQVIGGRLFVEGINRLSARDVYTGKVLWKRTFNDLGTFGVYYDETYVDNPLDTTYNQTHIPGANARGTNFVATETEVYLVVGGDCLVLDARTGDTRQTFSLPADPQTGQKPSWGYIGVYKDLLIAGAQFVRFSEEPTKPTEKKDVFADQDVTSSMKLVVMDRTSGRVLWTETSEHAFRHNTIVVGNDKLFCIDILPHPVMYRMLLRGKAPDAKPSLRCFNVRTGDELWSTTKSVFGTWLGYSEEHDILLQAGRSSSDMLHAEPSERIIAYRGADGTAAWDKDVKYSGPCIIHNKTVFMNALNHVTGGGALSLLTGEPRKRRHPLTGEEMPWAYHRRYGCNSAIASEYLLTFRSGAAGFYDLTTDSGTGNLGGFKSGCTSNLVAADGVLNAPDYTRTCTCPYQNQTSLALVHMPDLEVWTNQAFNDVNEAAPSNLLSLWRRPVRIRRMGLNFGAPGDSMAPGGSLWLDFPVVGGPSPKIEVTLEPSEIIPSKSKAPPANGKMPKTKFTGRTLRRHSSVIASGTLKWVSASAVIGVEQVRVGLSESAVIVFRGTGITATLPDGPDAEAVYTVRMYFAELENRAPGERVFDVAIAGKTVLEGFDIVAAAGGPLREVVREFKGIKAAKTLEVTFTPRKGEPLVCGLELVVEESHKADD
jgi:outer membrane protein assembly factor BamB